MWVANFDPSSASSPFSILFAAYRLWQSCPVNSQMEFLEIPGKELSIVFLGMTVGDFVWICANTLSIFFFELKVRICWNLHTNCAYSTLGWKVFILFIFFQKLCISSFGLKVRSLFGFVQLCAFLLWVESYNLLKFVPKLWMEAKIVHILLWVES